MLSTSGINSVASLRIVARVFNNNRDWLAGHTTEDQLKMETTIFPFLTENVKMHLPIKITFLILTTVPKGLYEFQLHTGKNRLLRITWETYPFLK